MFPVVRIMALSGIRTVRDLTWGVPIVLNCSIMPCRIHNCCCRLALRSHSVHFLTNLYRNIKEVNENVQLNMVKPGQIIPSTFCPLTFLYTLRLPIPCYKVKNICRICSIFLAGDKTFVGLI